MSAFGDALRQRVNFRGAQIAGNAREGLERALKQAAPVGKSSPWQTHEPGQLRDSIAVNVRFDSRTAFRFHAVAPVDYASFTNGPTSPHPIVAVNVRVLRFDWPRGGLSPAFFRRTAHPGSSGSGWFTKTLERWSEILQDAAS